jgi:hypothetical protein
MKDAGGLPFNEKEMNEFVQMEQTVLAEHAATEEEMVTIQLLFPHSVFHKWIEHLHQVSLGNMALDVSILDCLGTVMVHYYVDTPSIEAVETSTEAYRYWFPEQDEDDETDEDDG